MHFNTLGTYTPGPHGPIYAKHLKMKQKAKDILLSKFSGVRGGGAPREDKIIFL